MTKPLVVFGTGDIAQLAHYYFTSDSDYEVAGFTVDREFVDRDTFEGLPVVPFDQVADRFPPAAHAAFAAVSYTKLNALRRQKYLALKQLGYTIASYVSTKATVLTRGRIGENCFILEDNTIQPFVEIGTNVTMWSGNHIGHHSRIGDHCFLSSHVVVSGGVTIGESCFVGVNATLRDHVSIGDRCVIGAGALILEDAAPDGVYLGPATERSRVPSTRLRRI